jgi:hypothetical protein
MGIVPRHGAGFDKSEPIQEQQHPDAVQSPVSDYQPVAEPGPTDIAFIKEEQLPETILPPDNIAQQFTTKEIQLTGDGDNKSKETKQMEIVLVKDRETPGTWRFKENKEDHPITIYLTKEQVKELGSPESIKVTITAV